MNEEIGMVQDFIGESLRFYRAGIAILEGEWI